jgi:hypothetical protein
MRWQLVRSFFEQAIRHLGTWQDSQQTYQSAFYTLNYLQLVAQLAIWIMRSKPIHYQLKTLRKIEAVQL